MMMMMMMTMNAERGVSTDRVCATLLVVRQTGGVDKVMVRFKVRVRVSLRIGWYVAILGGMAFKQAHTPANS